MSDIIQRRQDDREISTCREGNVRGLCPAQVQGHVAAHLAAATVGAGESAPHQLPQPEPEQPILSVRKPIRGGTGQEQTRGNCQLWTLHNMSNYVILFAIFQCSLPAAL